MMKKIICLLSFCLASTCLAQDKCVEIEDKCDLKILTPTLTERKTLKLRLENGLEAYLISDPGTHQSAAALAVATGSYHDPKERPGLAHFLEHMLFMGTKKYPEESGYTQFLNQHGGMRNAFTASDRTVYMFSINNNAFDEALDRFAQFFIEPLFNPSCLARECKAVHQEFSKDIPLDPWRQLYVKKELANAEHPFHFFDIGSIETLGDVKQSEIKKWYESHYSADLMHLVIYSNQPIEKLKTDAIKIFSNVPLLKENALPTSYPPLFASEQLGKLAYIQPLQQLQNLELCWEIPLELSSDSEVQPEDFASHLLGDERENSLLALLKRANLAEGINAQSQKNKNCGILFTLSIDLTEKGVKEWEKVAEYCFSYLNRLKQNEVPSYIFEELQKLAFLEYEYQSRKDLFEEVTEIAYHMVDENLSTFPKQTLAPSVFNPKKVAAFISCLTPEKCFFTLTAPEKISGLKTNCKERWMGVPYQVYPIAIAKLKEWKTKTLSGNVLPEKNAFIPQNLELLTKTSSSGLLNPLSEPAVCHESSRGKLYFCQDDRFHVPEVSWILQVKTPFVKDGDPTSQTLADLYTLALEKKLQSTTYDAKLAHLNYSFEPNHDGFKIEIEGYSDKAESLLKAIFKEMTHLTVSDEEFLFFKENLRREYFNQISSTPLKQGLESLLNVLYQDYTTVDEKEMALEEVHYLDFKNFLKNVWSKSYLQGMLFGNMTQETALLVWKDFEETFTNNPYISSEHSIVKLAKLISSKAPAYFVKKSKLSGNALILATDCGHFSFERRAAHEILSQALEEPFFSQLRTKQQTAYIVKNWGKELERELYSFFAIQSHSHDTRDLLSRFELFIEDVLQNFQTIIPEDSFESLRKAAIHQLQHGAHKPKAMSTLLSTLAFEYDGQFDWVDKRIKALENLSYDQFCTLAKEFLGKDNTKRVAICVDGLLPKTGCIKYRKIPNVHKFKQDLIYTSRNEE